ncbi:MAG: UDP-N-acetylmuramate dehydrogenase, partial [bacterium]
HCNWRVGGPADLFLTVRDTDELVRAAQLARKNQQKITILGFGANVLVSDRGIRGLVVQNRSLGIDFLESPIIAVDSGTNLAVLAKQAAKQGVGGLEFLIGIPGTVGAAVAVNAGTRTKWMSSLVEEVKVLDKHGTVRRLKPQELSFSYRSSILKQSGDIVLTARLKGTPDSTRNIERKLRQELHVRTTQPTGPSAGSVFTNPPNDFAGRLIEACGLKGFRIGDAIVSDIHANFILNMGAAKAVEIKAVIDRVKSQVAETFNIELKEEIRYLGEW